MAPRRSDPASLRDAVRAAMPEGWREVAEMREAEDAARRAEDGAVPSTRRNRGGRPKSDNPKTNQVMVRLAPNERAILDERAGPGGVAAYLRALGLGREPRVPRQVPVVNAAAWSALGPCLANLNQLARHANTGVVVSVDLAPVLEDVRVQLVAMRAELLGRGAKR